MRCRPFVKPPLTPRDDPSRGVRGCFACLRGRVLKLFGHELVLMPLYSATPSATTGVDSIIPGASTTSCSRGRTSLKIFNQRILEPHQIPFVHDSRPTTRTKHAAAHAARIEKVAAIPNSRRLFKTIPSAEIDSLYRLVASFIERFIFKLHRDNFRPSFCFSDGNMSKRPSFCTKILARFDVFRLFLRRKPRKFSRCNSKMSRSITEVVNRCKESIQLAGGRHRRDSGVYPTPCASSKKTSLM